MAHFSGRRLARPFLPDVPADRLKCSCSLVEPGLHPVDLLELWVMDVNARHRPREITVLRHTKMVAFGGTP
jgi:hypothetical protein